jgi:hypothetical protein
MTDPDPARAVGELVGGSKDQDPPYTPDRDRSEGQTAQSVEGRES